MQRTFDVRHNEVGMSDDCRLDLFEVRACYYSHIDNLSFPGTALTLVGTTSPQN
jgi:hypothetical protein